MALLGGYDYDFVDTPPDRLVCKICHFPSKDAYLSVCCGHVFCKSCLDGAQANFCPMCREEKFVIFPNKAVDREVRGLHVHCTNTPKGCKWHGELNAISGHLENNDGCKYEVVRCPNGCGQAIQRMDFDLHKSTQCPRRIVICPYCGVSGEDMVISGIHKDTCAKFLLSCPNNCEAKVICRENMNEHRKTCRLELVQCEYHGVGCKAKMARKDLQKHDVENMKEHLMMSMEKLSTTENQLSNACQRISNLELLIFEATNMNAYKSNTIDPATMDTTDSILTSAKWSVYVAAMATRFEAGDDVCPIILKIPDFDRKKKCQTVWFSNSFYTHSEGYKMSLKVYAGGDGIGKGTHLSIYLVIIKGLYDDVLIWPLRGKVEIILLNQVRDSEHHSWTMVYDSRIPDRCSGEVIDGDKGSGRGKQQYISFESLHKITPTCQYLKDDCIFLQINKLRIYDV